MIEKSPLLPFAEPPPAPPERQLLAATLDRAIRDILNPPDIDGSKFYENTKHCRSACLWLRSHSMEVFSFNWVCHYLDISPKVIRRVVYDLEKKGLGFDLGNGRCPIKRGVARVRSKAIRPTVEVPVGFVDPIVFAF